MSTASCVSMRIRYCIRSHRRMLKYYRKHNNCVRKKIHFFFYFFTRIFLPCAELNEMPVTTSDLDMLSSAVDECETGFLLTRSRAEHTVPQQNDDECVIDFTHRVRRHDMTMMTMTMIIE